ncbi:cyclopropane-fatty-acyl-phospholipid synthase family protein [Candidatus Pelagibacter sp.]|nr:cyclopropane-fatty-acyl-phospholipid synthase family protein [Candidatus Pelagibacter sp.]
MLIYKISDSIVFNALKNIKHGFLEIKKVNGEVLKFGNPDDNLKVFLEIKDESLNYNLIKSGSVGLGESYMKDFFITNNLSDLIELTAKNINVIYKFSGIFDLPFINFLKNKIIKNTKNRSKENIAKHYDLGNDFFSLWLDKTLTYSSAIFENPKQDLFNAQNNKYQKLIDLLKPTNGSKILEIGCGWGGFAEYLGTNYDVKLDCITISKKQFEFAKERIHRCGLNEKVNIEIKDYRDLKSKYDHIASIEMIEAVGQNYLDSYFNTIKNNLTSSGTVGIQAITIDDSLFDRYKNKQDFIQKYIFPGGFLPSRNELHNYVDTNGLKFDEYNSYANHYSDTLIIWREIFNKKWDLIKEQGFDLTFKRMWEFYLSYCEAGFKSKNIDLIQFSLQNKQQ